jgi:hypothetical protein
MGDRCLLYLKTVGHLNDGRPRNDLPRDDLPRNGLKTNGLGMAV